MDPAAVLLRPVVSEKSIAGQGSGRYSFVVVTTATKGQIKEAVASSFSVTVEKVWTKKLPGKSKRTGKKRLLKRYPAGKIATVQLAKDQKIDLLEVKEKK